MGPHPLNDKVGMGFACTELIPSLRKGRHVRNLQWNSVRKAPMAWKNLYGARKLGTVDTIYERYGRRYTAKD